MRVLGQARGSMGRSPGKLGGGVCCGGWGLLSWGRVLWGEAEGSHGSGETQGGVWLVRDRVLGGPTGVP